MRLHGLAHSTHPNRHLATWWPQFRAFARHRCLSIQGPLYSLPPKEGGMLLGKPEIGRSLKPERNSPEPERTGEATTSRSGRRSTRSGARTHESKEADPHRAAYRERNQRFLSERKEPITSGISGAQRTARGKRNKCRRPSEASLCRIPPCRERAPGRGNMPGEISPAPCKQPPSSFKIGIHLLPPCRSRSAHSNKSSSAIDVLSTEEMAAFLSLAILTKSAWSILPTRLPSPYSPLNESLRLRRQPGHPLRELFPVLHEDPRRRPIRGHRSRIQRRAFLARESVVPQSPFQIWAVHRRVGLHE
jgi:hypothetical protein